MDWIPEPPDYKSTAWAVLINHIVTKSEKIMIKIQLESEKEFVTNSNEDGHMLGYLQNKKSESIWSFKNQLQ